MEGKFCPVRFVAAKVRSKSQGSLIRRKRIESDDDLDEMIMSQFGDCMSCAFSTAGDNNCEPPTNSDMAFEIEDKIDTDETDIMEDAVYEVDKLVCTKT